MESRNLTIRKTCVEDCTRFAEWEKMKHVTEFFSIDENRSYEDVIRELLLSEQDPSKQYFTIFLKDENTPIGRFYLSRIDPACDSVDITRVYIGDLEHRGKGFGEEAMRLMLEYCFMNLHMERVSLDHFSGNALAAALYAKLGFQYEGIARNAAKKNGKYFDLNILSMLRSEYFEKVHTK